MAAAHSRIRFAGRTWTVKTSLAPIGPGPNLFSADRVIVDTAGRLRLSIEPAVPDWTCAEVIAQGGFGYGRYRWRVASDVHALDPHAVLGLFLWSDHPAHTHREIDIEFARWGEPTPPVHGSFTVQNLAEPRGFSFPTAPGRSEHTLVWTPGHIAFRSRFGTVVHEWTAKGSRIPIPGGAVAPRVNLWLFRGHAPSGPQAVTIEDFSYAPTRPIPTRE